MISMGETADRSFRLETDSETKCNISAKPRGMPVNTGFEKTHKSGRDAIGVCIPFCALKT